MTAYEPHDARFKFLPAEIDPLGPRQVVERRGLDPMNQLDRLTLGRDEVIEPPRGGRLAVEVENPAGKQVTAAKIVQQPTIETKLAKSSLDRGEIKHGETLAVGKEDMMVGDDTIFARWFAEPSWSDS